MRSSVVQHQLATQPSVPPRALEAEQAINERCRVVECCYDILDLANAAVDGGIEDYTDGMYGNDPATSYEVAQHYQTEWLLDQALCRAGSRVLDVGCGNGRLLTAACRRGATGVGLTISPRQVARCRHKQLEVRLCNYREMDHSYDAAFDAVVANGSIEHFVHATQAAQGRADDIYREMFAIYQRVLSPSSDSGRLVTTIIHFGRVRIDARELRHGPFRFRWGSDRFHYSLLVRSFGGFYPLPGPLERCAAGRFRLVDQQDGTQDYLWTSEHWLSVLTRSLKSPRFLDRLLQAIVHHPLHVPRMLLCLVISQSWNWQFRGENPPMQLLRQTWQRV